VSTSCVPIVNTGLRLVIGSWNTMAISSPRTARISPSESESRSRPSNSTEPDVMRPGGDGTSRITPNDVTVLPDPDSPTIPIISPARTLKLTLSTTVAGPSSVRNCTDRPRTWSSASFGSRSGSRVVVAVASSEARSTVVRPRRPLMACLPFGNPRPSASRIPSPKVLNARIVSASAMLGTKTCHGWL
jgi:hypothetical protein